MNGENIILPAGTDLVSWIAAVAADWEGATEIMAGHTRVVWDPNQERLVAIVPGESSEAWLWKIFRQEFGDFAPVTFRWGINLIRHLPMARILLLMDDSYAFRRSTRQLLAQAGRGEEDAPFGERLLAARREFYQRSVPG